MHVPKVFDSIEQKFDTLDCVRFIRHPMIHVSVPRKFKSFFSFKAYSLLFSV